MYRYDCKGRYPHTYITAGFTSVFFMNSFLFSSMTSHCQQFRCLPFSQIKSFGFHLFYVVFICSLSFSILLSSEYFCLYFVFQTITHLTDSITFRDLHVLYVQCSLPAFLRYWGFPLLTKFMFLSSFLSSSSFSSSFKSQRVQLDENTSHGFTLTPFCQGSRIYVQLVLGIYIMGI